MNIHIVQLPHTFSYLKDLSLAFKKHGFNTVTFVANGFNQEQINKLNYFTSQYSFIKILDIPTKRILSHGQALNYAFDHSTEEFFCFADHDIFPTQSLEIDIENALTKHDVICMGDRPENFSANYNGFAASAIATQSGIPLATSFFSIYRRSIIDLVQYKYQIGFEQYFRKSQLPLSIVQQKDIQTLTEPFLVDTCKALSLVLFQEGKTTAHLGSKKVCHLGGLCGAISRFINSDYIKRKKFVVMNFPNTQELESFYKKNQKRHPKVMDVKRLISDYSLQLIIALEKGIELPTFISESETLNKTIIRINHETAKIF